MLGMDFYGRLSGAGSKARGDEGLNPGCVPREGEGTLGGTLEVISGRIE